METFPALPSFADDLAEDLLRRVAAGNPLFRWRREEAETIDNIFGEPLVGAPTPVIYHFSGTHHLAIDTPERISGPMLIDMARLTAAYTTFLAAAGVQEALWLIELSAQAGARRMGETSAAALHGCTPESGAALLSRIRRLYDAACRRIDSASWLVSPSAEISPSSTDPAGQTQPDLFAARALVLKQELGEIRAREETRLRRTAADFFGICIPEPAPPPARNGLRPVKTFRGFLSFEDLPYEERQRIERELHVPMGWGAPMWLQNALMYADGARTTGEIQELVAEAGRIPGLEPIFAFLAGKGLVRFTGE